MIDSEAARVLIGWPANTPKPNPNLNHNPLLWEWVCFQYELGLNSSGDELLETSIVRLIINEILGIKK